MGSLIISYYDVNGVEGRARGARAAAFDRPGPGQTAFRTIGRITSKQSLLRGVKNYCPLHFCSNTALKFHFFRISRASSELRMRRSAAAFLRSARQCWPALVQTAGDGNDGRARRRSRPYDARPPGRRLCAFGGEAVLRSQALDRIRPPSSSNVDALLGITPRNRRRKEAGTIVPIPASRPEAARHYLRPDFISSGEKRCARGRSRWVRRRRAPRPESPFHEGLSGDSIADASPHSDRRDGAWPDIFLAAILERLYDSHR
jgi:hypothetical protein